MSFYAIGIGGSGARCVEALIHLCAAGLGPDEITLVFVDPDRSNGNLDRALQVANWYRHLQEVPKGTDCALFRTRISLASPEVWTPFANSQTTPTLDSFFEYNTLKNGAPQAANLFEMLYSRDQRSAELNIGFRGRPSIGAGVFGARIDIATEEPWRTLASRIRTEAASGEQANVFAFGSVFGGTGAAGLPTIPRLVLGGGGVRRDKVALGATLLLPYFSFTPDRSLPETELYASPQGFLMNAKEALRYYSMCNPDYNRVYVLGADQPALESKFSIGGNTQRNAAGLVEFLAGLAALDFFSNGKPDEARAAMIGRQEESVFTWNDVPDGATAQRLLAQYARMSYSYLKVFYPRLKEIWDSASGAALRTPWYIDQIVKKGVDISDRKVRETCDTEASMHAAFLTWLREVQGGGAGARGFEIRLANAAALADPTATQDRAAESQFTNILLEGRARENSANDLWRLMCDRAGGRSPAGVSGLGFFQRGLHEVCA